MELWKKPEVKLVTTWEATGDLPASHWSNLRKLLRQSRVTIAAEMPMVPKLGRYQTLRVCVRRYLPTYPEPSLG